MTMADAQSDFDDFALLQRVAEQAIPAAIGEGAEQAAKPPKAKWTVPGFGPMTRISTSFGEIPAQTLRVGDTVRTREHGFQRVTWLDRIVLDEGFLQVHPEARPVTIGANAFGSANPTETVTVSPHQKFRVGSEPLRRAREVLQNPRVTIPPETLFTFTIFHCDEPCEIRAAGLWLPVRP